MSTYAYIRVSTLLQSKSSQEYEIMAGVRLGRPPGNSRQKEVIIRNLESICDGIREGRSITEMAAKLGVHRNTLRNHLNKLPIH